MRGRLILSAFLALSACAEVGQTTTSSKTPAADMLTAVIDISEQEVTVTRGFSDGRKAEIYRSPVSTGTTGYETPTGTFRPFYMSKDHRSSLYDDAPMPWSVFFNGNVAIHGTYSQRALGRPASHGCVRVHPVVAEMFYKQVLDVGKANTTIAVVE